MVRNSSLTDRRVPIGIGEVEVRMQKGRDRRGGRALLLLAPAGAVSGAPVLSRRADSQVLAQRDRERDYQEALSARLGKRSRRLSDRIAVVHQI